ncbi:TetR family transcriptional regulator [Nocardioides sp. J9]|uniref:TetR/AcrR family transcriptional regulator n=1 Tax=unclassified Nocardioides TaxID=2615069 RepID=UPI00048FC2A1|nr:MULTISPECIES: TetR/AcrR family transcriptional regulator [unclassified Nocardioides]TWG95003.1 TetR family transcriptional regulator [Nocardioides sp. J9]
MARRTPSSSARSKSGNSKAQILQAALRLAVERGYDGTTMADVSAESGLPIGSVYWHYANKEQLFVALLEHSYEKWMEVYAGPVGLRDKVERGIIGPVGEEREYTLEESFLRVAQMMALDKRLGGLGEGSEVRKRYVEIRARMFDVNVERVAESLPPEVLEAFPDLATRLAVLSLAINDGFYVHANTDVHVDLDFKMYADLAAQALEGLVERYAQAAREQRGEPAARA